MIRYSMSKVSTSARHYSFGGKVIVISVKVIVITMIPVTLPTTMMPMMLTATMTATTTMPTAMTMITVICEGGDS